MSALARFQDAFSAALAGRAESADPALAALVGQHGFAVYRNTVASACIDALQANYPTVLRLVGEQWFRAAAAIHVAQSPPRNASLLEYGSGFADFLARFGPAQELPYLEGVARLDRFWSQAHVAADATPLDPARLARLAPDRAGAARLALHPAAHWSTFGQMPVATIWRRHRDSGPDAPVELGELEWRGDAVLITRPQDDLRWCAIESGAAAFLDACARGATLAEAAAWALDAQPDTDLEQLMAQLLDAGAFREPD
ncbi:MAG: putative DNA-binding domain-containing protein [Burkholderiaceae bacterium]|nr:putative DNA-binding domain-containing protein [Burkholderiaceae bacterium]